MPYSSRYHFNIGDRVRNRHSGEEGRVSKITRLLDGTLLVTVAIFTAGLFVRNIEQRVVPGTIGGALEVVETAVGAGASAVASIARPIGSQAIQTAAAEAVQIADDIHRTTMADIITERLAVLTRSRLDRMVRNASPSIERTSAEAASDAIWDRIQDFNRRYEAVFRAKGRIDVHLNYLTAPGTINDQGQWMGGYLADVVHGRRRAQAKVLAHVEPLERILEKTKISPQLRQKYGSLIPDEVNTAYELLLHYRVKMDRLSSRDLAPVWKEYAAILSEAVRQHPGYQQLKQLSERIPELVDELHHQHRLALQLTPGAESAADPRRINQDFQLRGATDYQIARNEMRQTLAQEMGVEAPGLDLPWLNRVRTETRLAQLNRRAGLTPRSPTTGRNATPFYPRESFARPDARMLAEAERLPAGFEDMASRLRRVGEVRQGRSPGFERALQRRVGAVVEYNRVPHVITAIDPKTLRVTMTPAGSDAVLYSKGILNDTEEMAALTGRLAQRGFRTGGNVPAAARELAQRAASVRSVRIQGGLLGTAARTVDVPIPLLNAFLAGDMPGTEAGVFRLLTGREMGSPMSWGVQIQREFVRRELQRIGVHDLAELRTVAHKYGARFRSLIGIPHEQIGQSRALVEVGDAFGAAHLLTEQALREVRGGMTMGELAQSVAGRVRRQILRAASSTRQGPLVESFSQISKTMKDGEVLSGLEAVEQMGATNIFQSATETPTLTRMLRTEFEHRLSVQALSVDNFSGRTVAERAGGEVTREGRTFIRQRGRTLTTGQDPLRVFRQIFEEHLPDAEAIGGRMAEQLGRQERLALRATALGRRLRDPEREVPLSALERLAQSLGIELVEGSKDADRAYWNLVKARMKSGGVRTPEVTRAEKQFQVLTQNEFVALDALTARPNFGLGAATSPRQFAIDAAGRAQHAELLNSLIEAAEAGDFQPLREAGLQFQVGTRGEVELLLHGRSDLSDPYTYRRTGEHTGYARNRRGHVVPFGMDQITLSEAEVTAALESGAFKVLRDQEGAFVTQAAFRSQQLSRAGVDTRVYESALLPGERNLPAYRTEDGLLLGFQGGALNPESVFERTRALARHEGRIIGLDIETDIQTGQILNLTAQHYELKGGQAIRTGERLDIATPEFLGQNAGRARALVDHGLGGSLTRGLRTITKNGQTHTIDEIVRDEREIVRRAADYLNRRQEMIVGWHIGFDIEHLLDSARLHGMTAEYEILKEAAGNRVADVMLLEQAARPGAPSYSLESAWRRATGLAQEEAHIASPDVDWTAQVAAHAQQEAAAIETRLGSARQVRMKEHQYIWDQDARRGYQFAGVIDSKAAAELYQQETGELLDRAVGVALRPIDFTTGKAAGPLEFRAAKTPHGFGGSFFTRHELLAGNKAEMLGRLQETAEDLARGRVRRALGSKNAFTNLLLEEERLKLLGPLAGGMLGEHQWELFQRSQNAASAIDREIAGRVHSWSNQFLGDSRIVRQLELERHFFQEEIAGAHAPVVNWLKQFLEQAGPEGLREAKQQANEIWREYIQKTQKLEDFTRIEGVAIPEGQRKIALELAVLAEDPRVPARHAIHIGSVERAERDIQNLTHRIARRLESTNPKELEQVLSGAPAEAMANLRQRLRANKGILDNELGTAVERHIHETYILPALQQGQFSIRALEEALLEQQPHLTGEALKQALRERMAVGVEATSVAEALPQIVSRGQEVAQQTIRQMPENLTPRAFANRSALEALQQGLISQPVAEVHRELTGAEKLVFDLRHGVTPWVGRTARSVIEEAQGLGEGLPEAFTKTLRFAARNMSGEERKTLHQLLLKTSPGWIDEVMHIGPGVAQTVAAAPPVRAFDPGLGHRLGQQLVESVTANRETVKKLGIGASILVGGLLAIRAFGGPGQPPPSPDHPEEPNGIASTEAEVERRHQRLLRQQLLTHKVKVSVAAEDTQGVDHQEITDAVHQALGNFFGRAIAHQADVHDHRRTIDKSYLDQIAHHLFTKGHSPITPLPA